MQIIKAPEIEAIYDNRIRDLITGKREMRAIRYSDKRTKIHLSDVTGLCLMQPYYHRVLEKPPPPSFKSCWSFLRGRVIERSIASEMPAVTVDGVIGTVDDDPEEGIVEIKSTAQGCEFFKPEKEQPDWIKRMMGYCYMYERMFMYLFVVFIVGNLPNYMWWSVKKHGKKPKKYQGFATRAWKVSFDSKELEGFWAETLETKYLLEEAVKNKTPQILYDIVKANKPDWICKPEMCQYYKKCEYLKQGKIDDEYFEEIGL